MRDQDGRTARWPTGGISFGGDYNPEQWPKNVWDEDIRLMTEAGVTLVTLGVFSWGTVEPHEGDFDFAWLDEILDRLDDAGIGVDLATPTASPPIWLHQKHPEILPLTRAGLRYSQGGRLGWCASSPVWRSHALAIVARFADRYGSHPALRMWHVSNELGGGNRLCYCDVSAEHFRRWLQAKYGDVQALNEAWGSAVWGLRYSDLDQVLPPRDAETASNPGQVLDFARFSSDALLEHFRAERDVLRSRTPDLPITTNMMVGIGPHAVDYARWAPDIDILASDHYIIGSAADGAQDLAFAADRVRGFDPAAPWMLMEHSTSAVSWQSCNRAKEPGEMIRNSLAHVARGSDSVLFFQWRSSATGPEQFHSAMVPHSGTDTKVWRDVRRLGQTLRAIGEVASELVEVARVALMVDDEAGWAWQAGPKPHNDLPLATLARDYHRVLWERNVLTDVISPVADLDRYRLLVVPGLFLVSDDTVEKLEQFVERGGRLLVSFLSGIVDATNRVRTGGYPGAFRDLLGVFVEEFFPLTLDERVRLDNGWIGTRWSELVQPRSADIVARYSSGQLNGSPAITRRRVGKGEAWYVSSWLDSKSLGQLMAEGLEEVGIRPTADAPLGVEVVRRKGPKSSHLFVINHTAEIGVHRRPGLGADREFGGQRTSGRACGRSRRRQGVSVTCSWLCTSAMPVASHSLQPWPGA